MELLCLGGGDEIGKEGFLIKEGEASILFEYGVKLQPEPPSYPAEVEEKINAVFVTHAHLDHAGALPLLYKKQEAPCLLTPPTLDIYHLLIKDFLKVQEKKGYPEPFSEKELSLFLKHVRKVDYQDKIRVRDKRIRIFNAGHIPGSYSALVEGEKNIFFTGDINTKDTFLIRGMDREIPKVDVLVIESTYSDKEHNDRKEEEINFINKIQEYEDGIVLLPAFAVSRAQEVLLILKEYGILDRRKVYMDGMAKRVSDIILYHRRYLKDSKALKDALRKVRFLARNEQRDKALKEGSVIITTSGMLQGGPIIYYLTKLKDFENGCILLTGYQIEDTPGDKLLKTSYFESEGERFKVKMEVEKFDFSAHADRKELLNLIRSINPKKIVCVHGEKTKEFADELQEMGYEAYSLKSYETLEL